MTAYAKIDLRTLLTDVPRAGKSRSYTKKGPGRMPYSR